MNPNSRLRDGAVLLARDILGDPNFSATAVLLCMYSADQGAYGLVLNRPSHMPLSEIFDGFREMDGRRKIFIGGPVQQEILQVLEIADAGKTLSHRVAPRVFLGGAWHGAGEMLTASPETTYLFLGYSGWAAGQLEHEIELGAWDVFNVNVERMLAQSSRMLTMDIETSKKFLMELSVQ